MSLLCSMVQGDHPSFLFRFHSHHWKIEYLEPVLRSFSPYCSESVGFELSRNQHFFGVTWFAPFPRLFNCIGENSSLASISSSKSHWTECCFYPTLPPQMNPSWEVILVYPNMKWDHSKTRPWPVLVHFNGHRSESVQVLFLQVSGYQIESLYSRPAYPKLTFHLILKHLYFFLQNSKQFLFLSNIDPKIEQYTFYLKQLEMVSYIYACTTS